MDAHSLAALNSTAASPPRLLSRTAAALEGAAVTLYVFRVPGRRDLCLTPSKPLGDVITDLDVSTALYYVRFDTDPPLATMTLLRRNPATNTTEEVALIVEPESHVDVFAVDYSRIEETFWRMNGNEILTAKSNFGCTLHHSGPSYYFLSPWTGRCTFLPVKNGHALRCSHTLRIPMEDTVDISELRFNFSGHRIKSKHDSYVSSHTQRENESNVLSGQPTVAGSSSFFTQQSQHHMSTEYNSKRRSIFSRPSDGAAAGTSEERLSLRRSLLQPIHKRLQARSSSNDDGETSPLADRRSSELFHSKEDDSPTERTWPAVSSGVVRESLPTLVEGENTSPEVPRLPPRPLFGPRPLTKSAEDPHESNQSDAVSNRPSEIPRKPSVSGVILSRQVTAGIVDIPSFSSDPEFVATDAASRKTSVKRKPIGSASSSTNLPSADAAVGITTESSTAPDKLKEVISVLYEEPEAMVRSHSETAEDEVPALPPRPSVADDISPQSQKSTRGALNDTILTESVEQGAPALPPRRPVGVDDSSQTQDRTQDNLDHQRVSPAPLPKQDHIAAQEDQVQPRNLLEGDEFSKLDLSLGQEKLGGGSDGEQAKLAKLIVWSEGQKMLDLIVAANVLMFCRAYQAANLPG